MLFGRRWACKQKIIQWWSTWPGTCRNAVPGRCCYSWRWQFNSCNFIADFGCSTEKLAEFRKELQETKSIQFQCRVWNIFELMQPKLFKKFSCIKRKHSVLWTDSLIFSWSVLTFIFKHSILDVLTTLRSWKQVWC